MDFFEIEEESQTQYELPGLTPNETLQTSLETPSQFNDEFFLKRVSCYPAIYDLKNKGYHNKLLKDTAFENIARSMQTTVDICKKRWKSLREKYQREKQKIDLMTRSGAPAYNIPQWELMSFFNYMFDEGTPRNRESSPLPDLPSSSASGSHNYLSTPSTLERKRSRSSRGKTIDQEDPYITVLGNLTNSVQKVADLRNNPQNPNKIDSFAKYITSELTELPKNVVEEFIDETVIRILQLKGKIRNETKIKN